MLDSPQHNSSDNFGTSGHAAAAEVWHSSGFCVVPAMANGTKRPRYQWKDFQGKRAPLRTVQSWYQAEPGLGVGLICGEVSGNLEMTEIEGSRMGGEHLSKVMDACEELGIIGLWNLLTEQGYCEATPAGGIHMLYRIADGPIPGNTKIAMSADAKDTYAETRGEGGFVIVAPTGGTVHPTGDSWSVLAGRIGQVPTIDRADRDKLHEALRKALDERPERAYEPRPITTTNYDGQLRVGDDFNERADWWLDVLQPNGWQFHSRSGSQEFFTRPGKDPRLGHSAATGHQGKPGLYVWSGMPQEGAYSKFAMLTELEFNGDFRACTKHLASRGFGGELPRLNRAVDAVSLVRPAATPAPVAQQAVDHQQPEQAALAVQADETLPVLGHIVPHVAGPLELDLYSDQDTIVSISTVINAGHIPDLYVRDGQLVHVQHKSSVENNRVVVAEVTADRLNLLMANHVRTFKTVKDKNGNPNRKPFSPSITSLRAVVSSNFWPGVPALAGVIGTPTLRPDGSLIQEPGYDKATGLYLQPTIQVPRVPETILDEQVRASREFVFRKVFGEFCWVSPGDFANYMALLVSPMMRPFVKSTTPFGMFTATTPGSGKTNLTDGIGFTYGQSSQVLPSRTEELQKKITSILVGNSSPVVVFDNLKEGTSISSEILATLVTKETWDDRLLGASRNIEASNDRLWLASGNGLTVGGDMASRTVMVRLDPRMEKPELRNFEMGQFSDWIREEGNREELLFHLLILVQAWRQAGAPMDTTHTMRGFTRWAQVMGGFLNFHGLTGFLGNMGDLAERDTDAEEWGAFLAKWHEVFGAAAKTSKEMHASAQVDYVMGTMIDRWSRCFITDDEGMTPNPRRLGMMLAGQEGRIRNGYVLRKRMSREKSQLWWVEKTEDGQE